MTGFKRVFIVLATGALALGGCGTDYCWRSNVPQEMRTVAVPTFRNETDVTELGSLAARQVLREFQREGTFKVRSADEAALEIQGVMKATSSGVQAYDRRQGRRLAGYSLTAVAEVSVIDRRGGKVLVDNRRYRAETSYTASQDKTTAMRDASGRLAEDLARQIVTDVLNLKWERRNEDE